MKTIFLFIFRMFLFSGLYAQSPVPGMYDLTLKGKVKTLWERFYVVKEENNKYEEVSSPYHYDRKIEFDSKGNKIQEYWYLENAGRSPGEDYLVLYSFWTFDYNSKGQIDSCHWFCSDSTLIGRWEYKYDKKGRETGFVHYDGLLDIFIYHHYELNANGKIEREIIRRSRNDYSPGGYTYTYDEKGNMIKMESGYFSVENDPEKEGDSEKNMKEYWQPDWTGHYAYDEMNRLIYESGDGEYDTDIAYEYDDKGRLRSIKQRIFDDFAYRVTTYFYDHHGTILKINVDIIRDDDSEESDAYYRPDTSLVTEETTTYQYTYQRAGESWNWDRRVETKNGKKRVTYRDFNYYEE